MRDRRQRLIDEANLLLKTNGQVLAMTHVGPGRYTAEVPDCASESVLARLEAELEGQFLGEKVAAFDLPLPRTEMDDPRADKAFLRDLALRVGGRYADAERLDIHLAETFDIFRTARKATHLDSVWHTWWLFGLICLLLTISWFWRRALGLT